MKPNLSKNPLVSIVIPVGGNRINDLTKLSAGVEALLSQSHQNVEVVLVIDPNNAAVKSLTFPKNVRLVEFVRPAGIVGRDTNARIKLGWDVARGEILATQGVCMVWSFNLISRALRIMREMQVSAVDGITRRMPGDQSFLGKFQDMAILTEFPRYRRDFLLTESTFAQDRRLPCLTSFLMTREFYASVREALPLIVATGWEDYDTVRAMVEAGGQIFCTNRLVAFRNHPLGLRLQKQYSSGLSGAQFLSNNPTNAYARKRFALAILVAAFAVFFSFVAATFGVVISPLLSGMLIIGGLVIALFVLGLLNAIYYRDWQALLFPPLTLLQVGSWVAGFFQALFANEGVDDELLRWLHQNR